MRIGLVEIISMLMPSAARVSNMVAATMFETLAAEGINIEMISTSPIRISCVVRAGDVENGVRALHSAFELETLAP